MLITWQNDLLDKTSNEGHTVIQIEYEDVVYLLDPQNNRMVKKPDTPRKYMDENGTMLYYPTRKTDEIRVYDSKNLKWDDLSLSIEDYYSKHGEPRPSTRPPDLNLLLYEALAAAGVEKSPGGNDVQDLIKKYKDLVSKSSK